MMILSFSALRMEPTAFWKRRWKSPEYTQPSVSQGCRVRVWGVLAMPTFKRMSDAEKGLLRKWHAEGASANEIANLLGRDPSTRLRQVARLSSCKETRPVGQLQKVGSQQGQYQRGEHRSVQLGKRIKPQRRRKTRPKTAWQACKTAKTV